MITYFVEGTRVLWIEEEEEVVETDEVEGGRRF